MIIRAEKTKNYSVISNSILRDQRLSWQARGLASYLLTMPDNWQINREHLVSQSPDGIRAVRTALKELRDNGYITSEKGLNAQGKFAWITVLHESPAVVARNEPAPSEEVARNAPAQGGVVARNEPARNEPARKSTLRSTEVAKTVEARTGEGNETRARGGATAHTHPAVAIYRETFARFPNRAQAQAIADAVGETPDALGRYRRAVTEWALKGHSPTNVADQLDVFAHGWKARPPSTNGHHPPAPEPNGQGSSWDTPTPAELLVSASDEIDF